MEKQYRAEEVAKKLSISRATVWRWVKEGSLPAPIKIGARVTVWTESSLNEFLLNKKNPKK